MTERLVGKAWFERAAKTISELPKEMRENLTALQPNLPSRQKDAWFWYFAQHLGWIPTAFQMMMEGRCKAFTVPTEWPELFDLSYEPPAHLPAAPRADLPADRDRLTWPELQERIRHATARMTEKELRGEDYHSMVRKHGRPIGRFETPMPKRD